MKKTILLIISYFLINPLSFAETSQKTLDDFVISGQSKVIISALIESLSLNTPSLLTLNTQAAAISQSMNSILGFQNLNENQIKLISSILLDIETHKFNPEDMSLKLLQLKQSLPKVNSEHSYPKMEENTKLLLILLINLNAIKTPTSTGNHRQALRSHLTTTQQLIHVLRKYRNYLGRSYSMKESSHYLEQLIDIKEQGDFILKNKSSETNSEIKVIRNIFFKLNRMSIYFYNTLKEDAQNKRLDLLKLTRTCKALFL